MKAKVNNLIFPPLEIISCILNGDKCIYFSTPMTNGPRLISWRRHNMHLLSDSFEYGDSLRRHVFIPNCEEGQRVANDIRINTGEYVIDPSCYDVEGWSQEDYLSLWCKTILRYAKEVRFNNGWEYSNGCVQEYTTALEAGIPTKNISGEYISRNEAIFFVGKAVVELENVGICTKKLKDNMEKLNEIE